MLHYIAVGINATGAGTGIATLFVLTSHVTGTVFVNHTFGSAIRSSTDVFCQTRAGGESVDYSALRVRAAGSWHTGILAGRSNGDRFDFLLEAAKERIAGETSGTTADWTVVNHLAVGVDAAGTHTGILAPLSYTGLVLGTVSAHNTFWSADGRTAYVIRLASADRVIIYDSTVTIGTAGSWTAGVRGYNRGDWFDRNFSTGTKWVAGKADLTSARRLMMENAALSVDAAGTYTGIFTFVVDTGLA